jgi:hypothetical protein
MANDIGPYCVYNHTDRELIIATDDGKQYRLLPRSVSPQNAQPRFLWAAANTPDAAERTCIDGVLVWELTPGFDVHVSETSFESTTGGRAPTQYNALGPTPNLHIFGIGIKPGPDDEAKPAGRAAWFYQKDEIWVTVLGAGITGLTVAHELVTRGFRVQVIERAHGSPAGLVDGESGAERFRRGLTSPDVGGVARTQWATQPLARAEHGLMAAQSREPAEPSALRSVHGDAIWFGSDAHGPQQMGGTDGYHAFAITWCQHAIDPFAEDLQRWLCELARKRSISAVQLVVVAYTGDAPDHVRRAYERFERFMDALMPRDRDGRDGFVGALCTTLDRLQVLPTARIDVAETEPTDRHVGLIMRVHEDLGLIAGEHGFRFFPGFYRHLRDTMRRTPIFDPVTQTFTPRTALDNLQEVEWQVFVDPTRRHQAPLSRRPFNSIGGVIEQYRAMRRDLGYRPVDLLRFCLRILRYMTSSVKRRETYYEDMSWWTFLSKPHLDDPCEEPPFNFGKRFADSLRHASKALVAMASEYADARTQGDISVQLLMDQFGLHDASDSTLDGPTSTNWLGHWRTYLEQQGVRFFLGEVTKLKPYVVHRDDAPAGSDADDDVGDDDSAAEDSADDDVSGAQAEGKDVRMSVQIEFPSAPPAEYLDGEAARFSRAITDHYIVSALDLVGLARVLRQSPGETNVGVFHDVRTLIGDRTGFDLLADIARNGTALPERDLEDIATVGARLADRLQTLTGIQLYYDSHVSFANGHMYFAASPWGLSAISQVQFWGPFGSSHRGRLIGNLSIDIGSWRGEGRVPHPNDLDRDAIASQVQDQITQIAPRTDADRPERQHRLRLASFYHLDDYIGFGPNPARPRPRPAPGDSPDRTGLGHATLAKDPPAIVPRRNHAPFLINVVGEWRLRPRGEPWSPNDFAARDRTPGAGRTEGALWIPDQGGYPVHYGNTVVAGPHLRTFTRMTTMEAANESARHAVNAILDHATSNYRDPDDVFYRLSPTVDINVDKNTTKYGDYCDIWNPEQLEFQDLEFLRSIDGHLMEAGAKTRDDDAPPGVEPPIAPHLFDVLKLDELPDMLEDDRDAINALELIGSILKAFDDARIDDLPGVFAVVDGARKKLASLFRRTAK